MMTNLLHGAHVANKLFSTIARLRLLLVMFLTLTANVSAWSATWEKATSIAAGDVVLLVCESKKMELSDVNSYGSGTAYSTSPAGLYELTVEAGSSSGTFSLKNGNNYLYWNSGNSLATNATKSANTSWKVTFSNGNATISNAKDNSRKLQWNASSPRFACYTTSQTAVQLYKKVMSKTLSSISISGQTTTFKVGDTFKFGGTVTATYSDNSNEDVTSTATFSGYNMSSAGTQTVKVSYTEGSVTRTISYTITVSEPKKYKAYFYNGTTLLNAGGTEFAEGTAVSYSGSTPTSCDGESTTFVGWATSTWEGKVAKGDITPDFYDIIDGEDLPIMGTADVTYYSVFAQEGTSGSGSAGWNKVTATADLEAGATYAISSAATEGNYLSTYTGGNNFPNSTTTICKLVLGGSEGAWTFKINDASNYNNYYLTATSTTGSNYLKATNEIDNYCKFSISFENTGNAVIICTGKQSRNILRYNSSNNPKIFACYSSGQSAVYLQKYSTGSTITYSDYITTCTAETTVFVIPKCGGDGGGTWLVVIEWFATF